MRRIRQAFSLVELLVVIAVVSMLAVLLLPAVQAARESARKAECSNHLRQLGIGFSAYHDAWQAFPISGRGPWPAWPGAEADPWSHPTFYTALLPYIEQVNQTPASPRAIPIFLCPSRRGSEVGPKDDYAGGRNVDDFLANGWQSVLGGTYVSSAGTIPGLAGVSLNEIVDGSSNTLLLAHKAMRPSQHFGSSNPNSGDAGGWAGPCWNFEHERDPRSFILDVELPEVERYVGSPHPGAMPSLAADGSVHRLPYETAAEVIPRLWSYNDGTIVSLGNPW
jgi:prepilin-type N-terminal cleavage/methylation domain-containing protein